MKQRFGRYMGRTGLPITEHRKAGWGTYAQLSFFLCFFVGIVGANFMTQGQGEVPLLWNSYFLERFQVTPWNSFGLFCYVLETRLPSFLLLLLLILTGLGFAAGLTFLGWQGFALGFMMAAAVSAYSVKGIFLILTAWFPQYLVYIPVYLGCLRLAVFRREHPSVRTEAGEGTRLGEYLFLAGIILLLIVTYVTGIFLESYVMPFFLKKIVKIF